MLKSDLFYVLRTVDNLTVGHRKDNKLTHEYQFLVTSCCSSEWACYGKGDLKKWLKNRNLKLKGFLDGTRMGPTYRRIEGKFYNCYTWEPQNIHKLAEMYNGHTFVILSNGDRTLAVSFIYNNETYIVKANPNCKNRIKFNKHDYEEETIVNTYPHKQTLIKEIKELQNIIKDKTFDEACQLLNGFNKEETMFDCNYGSMCATIFRDNGKCLIDSDIEVYSKEGHIIYTALWEDLLKQDK